MKADIQVQVRLAASDEEPLLAAMLPGYLRELGVGTLAYPYLALYWVESNRFPYLIRVDGDSAGFALVRWLADEERFEMAEFYVTRSFRRRGVGRAVVQRLFAAHPGDWALSVLPANRAALAFWLAQVPPDAVPRLVDDPPLWPHLRLHFHIPPSGD